MSTQTTSVEEAVEAAKTGRKTVLRCPAHEDHSPSLSISPGTEQDVVIHCHAGCSVEDVIAAAGLDWADVCAEQEQPTERVWTPAGDASHVYPYHDEHGSLLYEVLRVPMGDRKRFFQRQPDESEASGYRWNIDGVRRLPYRLPQVLAAIANGGTIHIAEGEKCVHALLPRLPDGDEATCNSGGAGKFMPDYAHLFAGATVVIYADSDEAGRQHAREVRTMLLEQGCVVRVLEAPPGVDRQGKPIGDVADHLTAGGTLDTMLETTPESDAARARTGVDILDVVLRDRKPTEWVIDGTLARTERLIIIGGEGSGKSLLCRQIAACVAGGIHPFFGTEQEPRRVLFIDAENNPEQVVDSWQHLVGLTVRHGRPVERGMLTALEEWDAEHDLASASGAAWLCERVYAYRPDLLVLGPLTNLAHRDLREYETVDRMRRTINKARSICGSAVIMEHHAPHRGAGEKIREMRPYGSGLFLKWPEYCYGIQPIPDLQGHFEWRKNRGPRVRTRRWPDVLREGSAQVNSIEFPWVPAAPL